MVVSNTFIIKFISFQSLAINTQKVHEMFFMKLALKPKVIGVFIFSYN